MPRKLGLTPGRRVALLDLPQAVEPLLAEGLRMVTLQRTLRGTRPFDVIALFCRHARALQRRLPSATGRLAPAGGLWICWPKKASGVATDLSDGMVREAGLAAGLVDNKVCAIDDTWSALRFVIRLRDR